MMLIKRQQLGVNFFRLEHRKPSRKPFLELIIMTKGGTTNGEVLLEFSAKKPNKLKSMGTDTLIRTKALFHDFNNLLWLFAGLCWLE